MERKAQISKLKGRQKENKSYKAQEDGGKENKATMISKRHNATNIPHKSAVRSMADKKMDSYNPQRSTREKTPR